LGIDGYDISGKGNLVTDAGLGSITRNQIHKNGEFSHFMDYIPQNLTRRL